jgi:hypothetical protein
LRNLRHFFCRIAFLLTEVCLLGRFGDAVIGDGNDRSADVSGSYAAHRWRMARDRFRVASVGKDGAGREKNEEMAPARGDPVGGGSSTDISTFGQPHCRRLLDGDGFTERMQRTAVTCPRRRLQLAPRRAIPGHARQ